MKKILAVLFLSFYSLGGFAQGPISFGPKVGWNTDRLTTDYSQYIKDFKSGFQTGFFFSIYLKKFYVQPEAYFSIKRGALQTSFGDPLNPGKTLTISQTIKMHSIDIPLLAGYKLLDLKLVRLRIWGGPVVSYLIDKSYTLTVNGNSQTERITKDDFKDAYWSGQVGAGLDILMLTFDIGYEFGVDSFLKVGSLNDFNLRNNLFYCTLGWRLF